MTTDFNAATWTASDLLTEVYRAARLPDGGTVDYTPTVVLREATDAIWNYAGLAVANARDGRLATSILRTVSTSSVTTSGQDYELPPMAVGDTIDSVTWINASGLLELPLQVVPLGLETTFSTPSSTGAPAHFALLEGVLRIYPRPSETGSLRIVYQRRHGQLVVGSDTSAVSAVTNNAGFARVTLTSTPATFVANAWLDFMSATYPYRTKIHGASITTAHGSNQFTLSTAYTAFLAASLVGDTAVIYGKTPYVSLPMEVRLPLTEKIAAKVLADIGDMSLSAQREASAERGMARAQQVLNPRAKAAQQKMYNPRSLMRSSMRTRGRFWVD